MAFNPIDPVKNAARVDGLLAELRKALLSGSSWTCENKLVEVIPGSGRRPIETFEFRIYPELAYDVPSQPDTKFMSQLDAIKLVCRRPDAEPSHIVDAGRARPDSAG